MRLALAFSTLLLVSACDEGGPAQSPADLRLRVGETGIADGLAVTFEAVASDSRCPPGRVCIWAGEAAVRLRAGGRTDTLRVIPAGYAAQAVLRYGDVEVRAVDLTPHPDVADGAPPVVSLRVTPVPE